MSLKTSKNTKEESAAAKDQHFDNTGNGTEDKHSSDYSVNDILSEMSMSTSTGNSASKHMKTFIENIEETLKAIDPTFKLVTITSNPVLAVPGIIVTKESKGKLFHFSVIVADLIYPGKLKDIEEYIDNQKVVIDMPASKVYDGDYVAIVNRELAAGTKKEMVPTHYYTIPQGTDLEDERLARIICDTARLAISQRIEPRGAPAGKALASNQIEVNLINEINQGSRTHQLLDGEVVAADAVITVVAGDRKEVKGRPNQGGNSVQLSKATVKLDFYKIDPRQSVNRNFGMMQQGPAPAYNPMLIMTAVEGMSDNSVRSIENESTTALALTSLCQLAAGRNFASLLETGKNSVRRISLFGYDHEPFGTEFKPRELKVEEGYQQSKTADYLFQDMLEAFFHNTMTVAMDIRDGGRSSWAQQAWLESARGNVNATKYLFGLLDSITNNHFSRLMKQANQTSILRQVTSTIHNGTFEDRKQGVLHDIREMDYMYMLENLKEDSQNPNSGIMPYMNTFVPGATNGAQGLKAIDYRRKATKDLEPTAKFTGISHRVFVEPKVMAILAAASAAANLRFSSTGLYDQTNLNQNQWNTFSAGESLDYNLMNTMFQAFDNGNGNGNSNMYNHNGYNNWG